MILLWEILASAIYNNRGTNKKNSSEKSLFKIAIGYRLIRNNKIMMKK